MTKSLALSSPMRLYILLMLAVSTPSFAQITVEFPYSRLVFQRDLLGNGEVLIAGYSATQADSIQARLIPFAETTGQQTDWVVCRTLRTESQQNFSAVIKASAGWYNLEVRAIKDSSVVANTMLPRVGIGEVFVVAGQSNAQGQTNKEARSSQDPYERVGAFSGYDEKMESPSFKAEQLNHYISVYPVGVTSWCWAELGDRVANRLNIPVFFLNAAWGGTGSEDWANSLDSSANFERGRGFIPFGYLQRTIQFYSNILGFRAVLWHQGESDAYRNKFRTSATPPIDYFGNVKQIINTSRKQLGDDLAWVVSQTSLIYGVTDSLVLRDQIKLANELPNVFEGPYTDTLTNARFDGVHFTNEFDKRGLTKLAIAWDKALDSTFFNSAKPILPNFGQNSYVLESNRKVVLPAGFSIKKTIPNEAKSFNFLADETGNYYVSALLPCGKKVRQFQKSSPQGASFYESSLANRSTTKLVVPASGDFNGVISLAYKPRMLSKSSWEAPPKATTFTLEVDGCL